MATPTIVSATESMPIKGSSAITLTIQQDGSAKDLTGLTVTGTLRRESDQSTVIHADLEDHAVAKDDDEGGVVTITLDDDDKANLTVSTDVNVSYSYLLSLKCSDGYFPQPYRLFFHGVID